MAAPTFLIVTGLSGAGKSQASHFLEDFGYFCVDNLPPALIPTFAQLCASASRPVEHAALGLDVRGGEFFDDLFRALDELKGMGYSHQILFLDAEDETLVNRYKETRRRHPLSPPEGDLLSCIRAERAKLADLRERADLIINTTNESIWQLRDELADAFLRERDDQPPLLIKVVSFGFKHGIPMDSDLVFDVRFLANPNYEPDLKELDGRQAPVAEFIMNDPRTSGYLQRLFALMEFSLPHIVAEGKAFLTIAIGCTGGRHRSVKLAFELNAFLKERGYATRLVHRDLVRDPKHSAADAETAA